MKCINSKFINWNCIVEICVVGVVKFQFVVRDLNNISDEILQFCSSFRLVCRSTAAVCVSTSTSTVYIHLDISKSFALQLISVKRNCTLPLWSIVFSVATPQKLSHCRTIIKANIGVQHQETLCPIVTKQFNECIELFV